MSQRHAWLQKHPSPLAARGEFHWFPDATTPGDRALRASFVERVRGVEPPAVLWQVERGRVAWGQVFSATAPLDGRRYVGLVLSVVEGDAAIADLLSQLAPPPAAAWQAGMAIEIDGRAPAVQERVAMRRDARGDVAGVARALMSGGSAAVGDPTSPELPAWIASIERVLPLRGADDAARSGVWSALDADRATAAARRDHVAELAAAAWRDPSGRAAQGWTLLCELAVARGEPLDRVGAALESLDAGAVLTAGERAELARGGASALVAVDEGAGLARAGASNGAGERGGLVRSASSERVGASANEPIAGALASEPGALRAARARDKLAEPDGVAIATADGVAGARADRARVVDVLHAWGRGRLDASPAATSLPARLADLVALRVLSQLAANRDADDAIAEARWYALLSAARRRSLLAAVAARTRTLRAIVEAHCHPEMLHA